MTKRPNQSKASGVDPTLKAALAAYIATVTLYTLGAFLPGLRVWGINTWAYLPLYATAILIGMAALVAFVTVRWDKSTINVSVDRRSVDNRRYSVIALLVVVLWAVAFYVFRAKTHFLGDGYALLGNLAKDVPYAKPIEIGTELSLQLVKGIIGHGVDNPALLSYEVISMGAGVLFLAAAALFAGLLTEKLRDRVLLLLGLASGGYTLLFFGYVESYALLCLSTALFLMVGVLIARGKANRYLIIFPFVLASCFHLVGLALLPAALYMFFEGTPLGAKRGRLSFGARLLIATLVVFIAVVVFGNLGSIDLYYRLAFIPLVQGKFTSAGYTLFSPAHIADFFNLLLLLSPGLLIVLSAALGKSLRPLFKTADIRFLVIATISTAGAAFLLDPKLGMARDWDLLSFFGLPLVMLGCLIALSSYGKELNRPVLLILIIALGLLSLFSRVIIQHVPAMGSRLARDYMTLDLARNRWGFAVLQKYYEDTADSSKLIEIKEFRSDKYPETAAIFQARTLIDNAQVAEAKQLLEWAIGRDPGFAEAWAGLCVCYYKMRQYDSALVTAKVANGLNPNNPAVLFNMGLAYYGLNRADVAERWWLRSAAINSEFASLSLAHLYRDQGNRSKYLEYLIMAAERPTASRTEIKEAVQELINERKFSNASTLLNRLSSQGSDSSYVRELVEQYPELDLGR